MTRILVEGGTDTNVRNKQNETALDIAVRKKLSDVVTILECNSIQNIISDLEPSAEESPGMREMIRQREREGGLEQLCIGPTLILTTLWPRRRLYNVSSRFNLFAILRKYFMRTLDLDS